MLTTRLWHCDHALILAVAGEIDLATAPQLGDALILAAQRCPRLLVVDLTEVWFLSCAGLSVLAAAHDRAGTNTDLRVVAANRATQRPLRLTGLTEYLTVRDSYTDCCQPVRT